jgi:glycosyltransferase involved in cell wall biosynthesis
VVVPAYNEQDSVAMVIAEIKASCADADVLVVDDGSTDRTAERASAAGARVCRLPINLGVGGAMRTGFRYALANGYDCVVQTDADGQHDASSIPRLIASLDHADVVVGSRFAGSSSYTVRGPRRWAMGVLAWVLSRIAHESLTDVTSGYRAANRRAIAVFARHYPAEYLGDTVESLVIALRAGCRIVEVPVSMRARAAGAASQNPLKSSIYLARAVVALFLALVRRWSVPAFEEERR